MGKPDPILQDVFIIGDAPYSAFLFSHQVAWCPQKRGGEDMSEWMSVKFHDILRAEVVHHLEGKKEGEGGFCCLLPLLGRSSLLAKKKNKKGFQYPSQKLVINFAQKKKGCEKLMDNVLELRSADGSVLNQWAQTIQYFLSEFNRPKNLLCFINPFGGRRKAEDVFEKHIYPILQTCQVKSTVIRTQRQNHVAEFLGAISDEELYSYDAVVGVGGDGTVCEVVNGLLMRSLKDLGSVADEDLKASPLPVAVIPAGSTNALAYTLHGTDDPRTAVIHIVLGGQLPLDVASVHTEGGLERFIVGQLSYGYLADIMAYSEGLRWMGPRRYDYAGFCKFCQSARYEGCIDVKPAGTDECRKSMTRCEGGKGCEVCSPSKRPAEDREWKRIEGEFLGVSAANISLKCPKSPMGMAPFAHLSDGSMELILVRKTSRRNHLRYLLRIATDSRRTFALPFVERYRIQEFAFTPTKCGTLESLDIETSDVSQNNKRHSSWNCDGELLFQPAVRVKVHSNLIQVLARNMKGFKCGGGDSINETLSSSLSFTPSAGTADEQSTITIIDERVVG